MISPNELRIGSIVNYRNEARQITSISDNWLSIRIKGCEKATHSIKINEISEIPLTQKHFPAPDSGWKLEAVREGRVNVFMGGHYITTIDYLHQWQNLVFAVTGNELDVKI